MTTTRNENNKKFTIDNLEEAAAELVAYIENSANKDEIAKKLRLVKAGYEKDIINIRRPTTWGLRGFIYWFTRVRSEQIQAIINKFVATTDMEKLARLNLIIEFLNKGGWEPTSANPSLVHELIQSMTKENPKYDPYDHKDPKQNLNVEKFYRFKTLFENEVKLANARAALEANKVKEEAERVNQAEIELQAQLERDKKFFQRQQAEREQQLRAEMAIARKSEAGENLIKVRSLQMKEQSDQLWKERARSMRPVIVKGKDLDKARFVVAQVISASELGGPSNRNNKQEAEKIKQNSNVIATASSAGTLFVAKKKEEQTPVDVQQDVRQETTRALS